MSNRSNIRNKKVDKIFIAIVAALIIIVAVALIILRANANKPQNDGVGNNITASGDTNIVNDDTSNDADVEYVDNSTENNGDNADNSGSGNVSFSGNTDSDSGNANAGNNNNADGNNSNSGNNNSNNGNSNNGNSNNGNQNAGGNNSTNGGTTGDVTVSQPDVEITERADADYEEWLAATMVVCISMEYPDFKLEGIYTASETTVENKFSSDGTYVVFTTGGKKIAIHSVALSSERTAAGTSDISSQVLGYATFDVVSANINTSGMTEISVDNLDQLIEQSILVSVYKH